LVEVEVVAVVVGFELWVWGSKCCVGERAVEYYKEGRSGVVWGIKKMKCVLGIKNAVSLVPNKSNQ
jgi:hypothetical protein